MLIELEPVSARGNPFGEREFVHLSQVSRLYRFPGGGWGVTLPGDRPENVRRVVERDSKRLEAMLHES